MPAQESSQFGIARPPWDVLITNPSTGGLIETYHGGLFRYDRAFGAPDGGGGGNSDIGPRSPGSGPGTWAMTVPEPPTWILLVVAGALLGVRFCSGTGLRRP